MEVFPANPSSPSVKFTLLLVAIITSITSGIIKKPMFMCFSKNGKKILPLMLEKKNINNANIKDKPTCPIIF